MSRSIQCYDYPNNLREIYPKYAIFIQTCKFDKLGQHLMEAMSFSLPCVAYDVAYGPQDLISDERNGFLIKPNHLVDFASKVGLLIRNEELRYNMGRNAHASIHKFEHNGGALKRRIVKSLGSFNHFFYILPRQKVGKTFLLFRGVDIFCRILFYFFFAEQKLKKVFHC